MPGLSLNDFGDSIRFGASTGAEDEKNLDLISCDLKLFEIYTKGYVEGCGGSLTEQEIRMLPMGAKLMTLECGMRFLADYLQEMFISKSTVPSITWTAPAPSSSWWPTWRASGIK